MSKALGNIAVEVYDFEKEFMDLYSFCSRWSSYSELPPSDSITWELYAVQRRISLGLKLLSASICLHEKSIPCNLEETTTF